MTVKTVKFKNLKGEYSMIDKKQFMRHVKRWRKLREIEKRNRIIEEMEREDI